MANMKHVDQALELKGQLDKLRPISSDRERKIMQKFRLDWNYHSNNLEGNSLTFGETKTLLMHGITAGGKPLKDSLEIRGHNEGIKLVEEVVKQERPLTENFIRELHALLLKESYEVDAITPDGNPTKKRVEVGKYKTSPNHVKTKTGEIFHFAEPFEVPAAMHKLLSQYEVQAREKINPIILAATFHYEFIRIHPFDDGNGRMARILMNFIFMRFGFPPVIIKTQDKENYFNALRQADGGDLEKFIEYIAQNLIRSLEIMIAGAKGEEIEEPSDLDKKIALLSKEFESENEVQITKSKEAVLKIYDDSVARFYQKFVETNKKFAGFYLESEFGLDSERGDNAVALNRERIARACSNLYLFSEFRALKKNAHVESSFKSAFFFSFNPASYEIQNPYLNKKISRKYDEQLSDEEIDQLLKSESERHLKAIEDRIKNDQKN